MSISLQKNIGELKPLEEDVREEARKIAGEITIPQTAWCAANGFAHEKDYKQIAANRGQITWHTHFCFPNHTVMAEQLTELADRLDGTGLKLDRFGVSLDPDMALPKELRCGKETTRGLYFADQADWDELASFAVSQPHLGDNMIGAPASLDSCTHALKAGITTMGNLSQFFGWDYPEFTDVEARTKSAVTAIALMGQFAGQGALVHSNLDDGYGDKCADMGQLIGMALIESYLAEDLLGAKVAHSFGDMFHSPYKRLVFTSALSMIHGEEVFGSMVFSNKLGRSKKQIALNDAHLMTCMLYDMAGQVHYRTGHAVTVMADRGLDEYVTVEEVVKKLAMGKELEAYLPEVLKTIDFDAIDWEAEEIVERGIRIRDNVLTFLSNSIDICDPYLLMLAIKKAGVRNLMEELSDPISPEGALPADYDLFEH